MPWYIASVTSPLVLSKVLFATAALVSMSDAVVPFSKVSHAAIGTIRALSLEDLIPDCFLSCFLTSSAEVSEFALNSYPVPTPALINISASGDLEKVILFNCSRESRIGLYPFAPLVNHAASESLNKFAIINPGSLVTISLNKLAGLDKISKKGIWGTVKDCKEVTSKGSATS